MQCPTCNTTNDTVYVGLFSVECTNTECTHYKKMSVVAESTDHLPSWYKQTYNELSAFSEWWVGNRPAFPNLEYSYTWTGNGGLIRYKDKEETLITMDRLKELGCQPNDEVPYLLAALNKFAEQAAIGFHLMSS